MVDFNDVLCNVYDLQNKDLMRLRDEINQEIQRREKKQELEAKKKIMQAIQDYLAAGYSLYVKGEVECEDDDWGADYRTIFGEVGSVEIEDDGVALNFIEQ